MKFYQGILVTALIVFYCTGLAAQHIPSNERGDPNWRATAKLEGNNVRTNIFNYGQTGRTGAVPIAVETPYEWPKNTGKVYLALTGLFFGGEVVDEDGVTQRIVSVMNYRENPNTRQTWNFEPVPGYHNFDSESPANSADPNTWPSFWPDKMADEGDPGWAGKWNGYFGKDIFNADQEIFYRASDDRYDRYNFFPDTTDLTRRGMGLLLDARALAWSQILVSDVVYLLHFIKNDGTKDIQKFAMTVWVADFVGGDGDSQDDITDFDLLENIIWSHDADHKAPTFGSDPVGIVGVSILETPGNAVDRIDNDGDGESNGPKVTEAMLIGEDPTNLIDDNDNGLIDENMTYVPFGTQVGVTFADYIDNNGNGEDESPLVTQDMVNLAAGDKWKRWPVSPENDPIQKGRVHLLFVDDEDIGRAFKDNIDNDGDGEEGSPVVTQDMIDLAALDAPYYRYEVPGTNIILYDVKPEDLGKAYADGVDNDGNRAVDEGIDEDIDEMIDERRDDGIDNDGDWNILTDDVGLDGVPDTGDEGEGDGVPTSGAGTPFPGEPNIDKTDVAETDQLGITNAFRFSAGSLNISSDAVMWFDMMIPGKFYNPQEVVAGEFDVTISTAYFPLRAGQEEPVSLAVILANGPANDPNANIRKQAVLKKRVRAQETYNNDYQFANAPITPRLWAVPGNNRVTLYWDNAAESSFDSYINNIGGEGFDFEGYRLYRSSDPALEDVKNITNAFGEPVFSTPIAQFDIVNEYGITPENPSGLDSTGLDGANFFLGYNNGLRHSFVDSTAKNGFTYYYVLTSYDRGFPAGDILPTESPFRINVAADGSVQLSKNVARVIPGAPSAGFVPATLGMPELVQGTTTGKVFYEIVDPDSIRDNHVYRITFEDTLIIGTGGKPDILTTKSFTLTDSTSGAVLIDRSRKFNSDYEQPLTHGFRLSFLNEEKVALNLAKSGWNNSGIYPFEFQKFVASGGIKGEERPNDYQIIFGEVGFGRSTEFTVTPNTFPAKDVNFKVYNISTGEFIDFGFIELDTEQGGEGVLSFNKNNIARKDRIVFLEPDAQGDLKYTWWFFLNPSRDDTVSRLPGPGDEVLLEISKPFLVNDVFRLKAQSAFIEKTQAKDDLDKIKVVPNPYRGFARFEVKSIYDSGRAPRLLQFTNLPNKCTIRIFTINGELVDTIEHESSLNHGTAYWDMLSKDNLSISYGVYIYHVDAPGIGEKVGKFAVIK